MFINIAESIFIAAWFYRDFYGFFEISTVCVKHDEYTFNVLALSILAKTGRECLASITICNGRQNKIGCIYMRVINTDLCIFPHCRINKWFSMTVLRENSRFVHHNGWSKLFARTDK